MGFGLWHNSVTPVLQSQLPSGRENLHRLSQNLRAERVSFVDEVSSGEAKSTTSQADLGFRQLCWGSGTIRPLLSKRIVQSSGKLGHNGRRIVACAAGDSGESGERFFGCSSGLFRGALFSKPLWSNVAKIQGLEFRGNGIGGGYGNGGQGGGGSSGSDGSGSGKFGHETHVSSVGDRDEEHTCRELPAMGSQELFLASLSSAAGDSMQGETPFALFGRWKRPGAADETAASATSKTPGSQGGSSGQFSGMENKRGASVEMSAAHAVQKDGDEATAKRSETAALRRLQRETFEDLMRVRERLDKLEFHTGLRKSKAQSPLGDGAAKTRLTGEVCAGGAFLLLDEESSRYSRAALAEDLHTGMDARFTFETFYRERDVMITECSARHSGSDDSVLGGPISVTKLVYNARVTDDFNFVVAPLGARGSDIIEAVNPLQGQALTQFARVGPAMYRHCVGSALGATLKGKMGLISLSQYLSGWGTGSSLAGAPLALSTLAHVLFQPSENSVFSLSAVNRFWTNPSVRGLRWSEMGPLVLSKARRTHNSSSISPQMSSSRRGLRTSMDNASLGDLRTESFGTPSNGASRGTPYGEAEQIINAAPEPHGSATQSIALAGEIDVGANVSLAGWAQANRGNWFDVSEKEIEWGVSLTKAVGKTVDWGLCVGSSKVDLRSAARNENNAVLGTGDGSGNLQLHMEAFVKLSVGRGFTLQPGLVYLRNKQSQTPALMLRSSWAL